MMPVKYNSIGFTDRTAKRLQVLQEPQAQQQKIGEKTDFKEKFGTGETIQQDDQNRDEECSAITPSNKIASLVQLHK